MVVDHRLSRGGESTSDEQPEPLRPTLEALEPRLLLSAAPLAEDALLSSLVEEAAAGGSAALTPASVANATPAAEQRPGDLTSWADGQSPLESQDPAPSGWETILSDDFEGAFPGSWALYGSPTWGDTSYTAHSGTRSAYCVGSGVTPPGPYPNNASAWIVYGPFSLSEATAAKVDFWYRNQSEASYDYIKWLASTDDMDYYGWQISGDQSTWRAETFDLTSVPTLGDLRGQSQVWFAFVFRSDSSITDVGAFVDDVVISKYTGVITPDLASVDLYPADPADLGTPLTTVTEGQSVRLVHKFTYTGPTPSGTFTARLELDNDTPVDLTGTVDSAATWYYHYPWTATAGDHRLQGWLDLYDDISESDESNNYRDENPCFTVVSSIGEIHGSKWDDLDGDGDWDGGEPGLADWTIYVDQDLNGQWDAGEPFDVTDGTGAYALADLPAGTYVIGEVPQGGWGQTYPNGDAVPAPGTKMIADDAISGFTWSGWQGAEGGKGEIQAAVFDWSFHGTPLLDGQLDAATVSLPGEDVWQRAGDPALPVRYCSVLLPQGADVASVEVDLGAGIVMGTDIELLATPLPTAGEYPGGDLVALGDEKAQFSFPQTPGVIYSRHLVSGYSIAALAVFPVHYDYDTKSLIYYSEVSLRLTTVPDDATDALAVREADGDVRRLKGLVDNDSAINDYASEPADVTPMSGTLPPGGPSEYVIITSQALESSFEPLVNQKIARGLTAEIVTTEYIYGNFTGTEGGDNADKIRDFITAAYTTWGTQWVLLGGDTDVVPYRGAYGYVAASGGAEVDNNIPTDLYFACLDGPWNGDGDAIWGESNDGSGGGDVDLAPDLAVGRAPVSNSGEAANFVSKTVQYETTAHPRAKEAVFLGEQLDALTWGGNHKDIIASNEIPFDWTVTEHYEKDGSWSAADLIGDLNASPHIVNHDGHSNTYTNAKLSRSDVDALTNTHPYFMYSVGCYSGAFDASDCIAEHHVNDDHGAFGVVMNSRYGWYWLGSNSDGPGFRYDREFWDAVFDEDLLHMGEAQNDSKMDNLASVSATGAFRWLHYCITLFGDPETPFQLEGGIPGTHTVVLGTGQVVADIDFGNQQGQSLAPGRPDLLAGAVGDTGWYDDDDVTNLDNASPGKVLAFLVDGTVPGAMVTLYADGAAISVPVEAAGTSVTITTDGVHGLADGSRSITARQTEPGKLPSADSGSLSIVVDTVAPSATAFGLSSMDTDWVLDTVDSSEWTTGRSEQTAPWQAIDLLVVDFDGTVFADSDDLSLTGQTVGPVPVTGPTGVGSSSLAWSSSAHLESDRYQLLLASGADGVQDLAGNALDGNGLVGVFPSGDGTAGGDWTFDLNLLIGDASGDGFVDGLDYVRWANYYQMPGQHWDKGDMNGDGYIDGLDYTIWANHYFDALPAVAPSVMAGGAGAQEPLTASIAAELSVPEAGEFRPVPAHVQPVRGTESRRPRPARAANEAHKLEVPLAAAPPSRDEPEPVLLTGTGSPGDPNARRGLATLEDDLADILGLEQLTYRHLGAAKHLADRR